MSYISYMSTMLTYMLHILYKTSTYHILYSIPYVQKFTFVKQPYLFLKVKSTQAMADGE